MEITALPAIINREISRLIEENESNLCEEDDVYVLAYPFHRGYERFRMSNTECPSLLEITMEGVKFMLDNPDKAQHVNVEKQEGTGVLSLKIVNDALIINDLVNFQTLGRIFLG
ncbi:MAG: hypothetical protein ACXAEU_25690 [Candidatus Hodarchaeales archaeon]